MSIVMYIKITEIFVITFRLKQFTIQLMTLMYIYSSVMYIYYYELYIVMLCNELQIQRALCISTILA